MVTLTRKVKLAAGGYSNVLPAYSFPSKVRVTAIDLWAELTTNSWYILIGLVEKTGITQQVVSRAVQSSGRGARLRDSFIVESSETLRVQISSVKLVGFFYLQVEYEPVVKEPKRRWW